MAATSVESAISRHRNHRTLDALLLAAVIGILVICGTVTFQSIQRIRRNADLVAETHETLSIIDQLESAIKEAETGQRGYIITGNKEYLTPLHNATDNISNFMEELHQRSTGDASRQKGFKLLKPLIQQKMDDLNLTIMLSEESHFVAAEDVEKNDIVRQIMDEIHEHSAAMRSLHESLLGERAVASEQAYGAALLTALISTIVGLSLVAAVFWTVQDGRKKTEAAAAVLFSEREQLQVTLASIGDGVIVCDHNCHVTFLNPVSERLTGWSNREARGQALTTVFNIVTEGMRSTVENPAARAIREGSVIGFADHTLLISRSGSVVPIDDSASPIRDARHNITGAVLVFRDATRRRSEERRLHEAAEFTRSIVDTLGELVVVLDGDMQVLHVNRAFSTTFQLTDDRILGRFIFQIDEGQWDLPAVHELLEGALNKSACATHIEIEQRLSHAGRKFLRLTANRFAAGSDRSEAVLLVISDVTEERVLEEANRRQDQHMRWFLEQIKDYAIFTMDVNCRAISWNQGVRQVLGFDEDEFVGHDIPKLIYTPEAQAAGIPATEFSVAALDQRASDDRWMMRKGGKEFWASGITSSIRDQDGHLIGYSKVMRDLTSTKKSQEELSEFATRLSEMNLRKNEFLATLAHELRNPLAPIKNAVQLMGMLKLDSEAGQLQQMMARQVDQLVRLIDDLMDVSRISRGKISLRSEIVELPTVISAAVEASSAFIAENGQHLIVNVPAGDAIRVNGDASRLTQVISNLLNNSAKYSDAGARIELSLMLDGRVAVITVRDNGIGIAADMLPSIFQMFSQADDTLERGSAGLGIGLTLVKTLVELHDGSVAAQSEGLGKGSVFTVRLPTVDNRLLDASLPDIAPEVVSTTSFKVLVVEDMRSLRLITARLLEKLGHEVQCVENGPLALLKLDTFTPDVVFSDIAMPGMTGYELARRIRQRSDCSHVHLVAVTGFGQSSDRDRALDAGFDEHMVKPVDIAVLKSMFDKL